jgi:hypothetical protein
MNDGDEAVRAISGAVIPGRHFVATGYPGMTTM